MPPTGVCEAFWSARAERADALYAGTWTTRGAGGAISGTVSRGRIQARATSPTFSASLAMNTSGSRQSISIQSPGSELEAVNISLSRSR